ncbi:MAG TPA: hypothetical protein VH301_09775 [Usitatibacter sp.]|jgi:hypothetical protein|nr:hypothetical protein [Usitatibacter sp.]
MKPNPILTLAAATAAALALGSLGACSKLGSHNDAARVSMAASPSAQLVGTKPADPTPEPAGVKPVVSGTTDVTQSQAAQGGPKEGDDHSYSTLDPNSPQKGDQKPDASNSRGGQ